MEIDPGQFFAAVLDIRLTSDSLLEEIERFGKIDRRLAGIERAIEEIEASPSLVPAPAEPSPPAEDVERMVADFVRASGIEQRRRLGAGKMYCHPAFAAACFFAVLRLR